jgi:site-specific DNA recombinase
VLRDQRYLISLFKRYNKAVTRLEKLKAERFVRQDRGRGLQSFINSLGDGPLILETWDEQIWMLLILKGTIQKDGSIEFEFKNSV